MKPRTKFQQSVVAASKHLPPLTPAQIEWGYKNCIEPIGRSRAKVAERPSGAIHRCTASIWV